MLKLFTDYKEKISRFIPWASAQPQASSAQQIVQHSGEEVVAKPARSLLLESIRTAPKPTKKFNTDATAIPVANPEIKKSELMTQTQSPALLQAIRAAKKSIPLPKEPTPNEAIHQPTRLPRPALPGLLAEIQNARKPSLIESAAPSQTQEVTTKPLNVADVRSEMEDEAPLTEAERVDIAEQIAWLKNSTPIEKIEEDLKTLIEKGEMLDKEINDDPDLLSETLEQKKINDFLIDYFQRFLDLKKILHNQHNNKQVGSLFIEYFKTLLDHKKTLPTNTSDKKNNEAEIDPLLIEYDTKLRKYYLGGSKNSVLMLIKAETELRKMKHDSPEYRTAQLLLKSLKHRISGKKYSLDMQYEKIETALKKPAAQDMSSAPSDKYIHVLSACLAHLVYSKLILEIGKCKQELHKLDEEINSTVNPWQKYCLITDFNMLLAELILYGINATLYNNLIKILKQNKTNTTTTEVSFNLTLVKILYEYFLFYFSYTEATIDHTKSITRGLKLPRSLVNNIKGALESTGESLECSEEFTRYVTPKDPPPIPQAIAIKKEAPPIPQRRSLKPV